MFSVLRNLWQPSEVAKSIDPVVEISKTTVHEATEASTMPPTRFTYSCSTRLQHMGPGELGGNGMMTDAIITERCLQNQPYDLSVPISIKRVSEQCSDGYTDPIPEWRRIDTFIRTPHAAVKHHRPYRYDMPLFHMDDTEVSLHDRSGKEVAHAVIPLEPGEDYARKGRDRALVFFDNHAQSLSSEEQNSMRSGISTLIGPKGDYLSPEKIFDVLGGKKI